MSAEAALRLKLSALRRRARLLVAERMALIGGSGAAGACLVLVALDRLRLVHLGWPAAVGIVGAGAIGGWTWGALRRLSDFDVARAAEERLRLKERVSSAVVLGPAAGSETMVQALVSDAADKLGSAAPAGIFPRRLGRPGRLFIGALVVLAAAMILPELPFLQSAAARRERAAMKEQGERLVKLAEELEKPDLSAEQARIMRQLAANLKALGKDMKSLRITRKRALVRIAKLEKEVELAKAGLLSGGGKKSLAKAAAELKAGPQSESGSGSQKAGTGEAKGTGEAPVPGTQELKDLGPLPGLGKPSEAQRLLNLDSDLAARLAELLAKEDMQAALAILAELAEKLEQPDTLEKLSPEELKRLEEELRKLAEALKDTDLDELARRMLEMAEALKRGDLKLCQKKAKDMCSSCLGLGASLSACNAAALGLGSCRGGQGVGPDMGSGRYDPNAPHDVSRGTPTRIPTKHYDTRIPGQEGEEGDAYSIQVMGQPDEAGEAQVPYYEVYSDYAKAAESALDREEIPPAHRERVKSYFESLQPEK